MMPIKTVLFDLGGVLVELNRKRCLDAFHEIGFPMERYLDTYKQTGMFSMLESGKIDASDICRWIRKESSAKAIEDKQIWEALQAFLVDIPKVRLDCLLRLKRHYRLAMLSNTNPIVWDKVAGSFFRHKGYDLDDFFAERFLSFELGMEKPSPLIYQKVIEGLGEKPEEILFIDDSEVNCRAGEAAGMRTLLSGEDGAWMQSFNEEGLFVDTPGFVTE